MLVVSLILGVLSLTGAFVGIFPCLGWFNWLNLPLAFIGLILAGYLFLNRKDQSRGLVTAALAMNGAAAVIGIIRLILGGGIL